MSHDLPVHKDRTTVPIWLIPELEIFGANGAATTTYPYPPPAHLEGYIGLHQSDYLRLSERESVQVAKAEAIRDQGNSFFGSTIFSSGNRGDEHQKFKALLCQSMQTEDILLFTSGWSANVGLIEAIAKPKTPIYLDQMVHASLVDGARLSAGQMLLLRHNDPNFLEARIRRSGPGIVAINSFYPTTGAVSDLAAYVDICERTGSVLVLDEAHSLGMVGEGAGGLAVQLGLADRVHFRTASFSKALGGHGGCVATTHQLAWFLTHRVRSAVFSSAVLLCDSAGHRQALSIAQNEPELARNCLEMAHLLRTELDLRGVGGTSACQIVSIPLVGRATLNKASRMLRDRGVLVAVLQPGAAHEGTGRLRLSAHANLRPSQVVQAACAIADVVEALHQEQGVLAA